MEWSNRESPHAAAATDPASVHATNMKFGNLEFCVEVEEHDFSDPMELINGYCSCVSSESCQGIMPTVDKYLSNILSLQLSLFLNIQPLNSQNLNFLSIYIRRKKLLQPLTPIVTDFFFK